MTTALPSIPTKRYFTIGEVSDLCGVKPHVLRYWEQEFAQLKPIKRRGNRRYYQRHEVLLIRRIRELLYDKGFTISGARQQLINMSKEKSHFGAEEYIAVNSEQEAFGDVVDDETIIVTEDEELVAIGLQPVVVESQVAGKRLKSGCLELIREELIAIRQILDDE